MPYHLAMPQNLINKNIIPFFKRMSRTKSKNILKNQNLYVNIHTFGGVAQLGERLTGSQKVMGSSPTVSTKKEVTFVYQKLLFFYPSRRLGISSPHKVRCISSAPLGLYLITRQRVFFLRLDEIQHCVLVIYNASH